METGFPVCQPDTEVSLPLPASSSITVTPPLRRNWKPLFSLWAEAT